MPCSGLSHSTTRRSSSIRARCSTTSGVSSRSTTAKVLSAKLWATVTTTAKSPGRTRAPHHSSGCGSADTKANDQRPSQQLLTVPKAGKKPRQNRRGSEKERGAKAREMKTEKPIAGFNKPTGLFPAPPLEGNGIIDWQGKEQGLSYSFLNKSTATFK